MQCNILGSLLRHRVIDLRKEKIHFEIHHSRGVVVVVVVGCCPVSRECAHVKRPDRGRNLANVAAATLVRTSERGCSNVWDHGGTFVK